MDCRAVYLATQDIIRGKWPTVSGPLPYACAKTFPLERPRTRARCATVRYQAGLFGHSHGIHRLGLKKTRNASSRREGSTSLDRPFYWPSKKNAGCLYAKMLPSCAIKAHSVQFPPIPPIPWSMAHQACPSSHFRMVHGGPARPPPQATGTCDLQRRSTERRRSKP